MAEQGSPGEAALVIGAGPAGLMAADVLSGAGVPVVIAEARPSPGRKLLMAGKSGLNITKDEPDAAFLAAYPAEWRRPFLTGFGPREAVAWAEGLGQDVFTGSSGRVFPVAMKGSPLLRAWLRRLDGRGADLRTGWRWTGWQAGAFRFEAAGSVRLLRPKVAVLALGGASWPRLGSDGGWVPLLAARGVPIAPFRPANMGFSVDWTPHMARHFGQPVKNVVLTAGRLRARGEFVVSARGIEGGAVYAVSAAVRDGAALALDLVPDLPADEVARRLAGARAGDSMANRLRKALGLDPVKVALLREWGGTGNAAADLKALPVRHAGPRPLAEAISSAGGIRREAVTDELELRACPGVFAAGEMLDWEAPTGGYLITGCLATGRHAGKAAARRMGA